ncbi:unnamed protein product [Peniophora sp. CBMAI 1063]|nr:unnamed protein product [Peniophora sp. CBMAI 1063]
MTDYLNAELVLRQRLENTVIARAFGVNVALERMRRFVRAGYVGAEHAPALDDSIVLLLNEAAAVHHIPLSCIAFAAHDALRLHITDRIGINTPDLGWTQWCVFDLVDPEPWLIVPMGLFVPFRGTKRSESALQRTDMLPLFFARSDGGTGVSVAANTNYETIPNTPTRVSGTSLKVIINLPNYTTYERQIQLRCPANGTVSAQRLARIVAAKVRECVNNASQQDTTMTEQGWRFGAGVGCLQAEDIILLGIVFVSPGKVTPLLKARSDYDPFAPFHLAFNYDIDPSVL